MRKRKSVKSNSKTKALSEGFTDKTRGNSPTCCNRGKKEGLPSQSVNRRPDFVSAQALRDAAGRGEREIETSGFCEKVRTCEKGGPVKFGNNSN